ncbi:protein of unknown function [Methylacidimicrobium sp. AP8]|uniref:hypothetical protein n=1 Tax=Methylacidimicrobium sp. AP8 TaxID=2730359 RepID=UPI0018C0E94E|nr:hypothetical protein [Methylacidimicrobium sp. AP8]CAB4244631.1 protein of unknown function [Methylacidimicrobium sp. AP8]
MADPEPAPTEDKRAKSEPLAWLDKWISPEVLRLAADSALDWLHRLYPFTGHLGVEVEWKKERCWWVGLVPGKSEISYLCAGGTLLNHTRKPIRLLDVRLVSSRVGADLCYRSILSSPTPANREIEVPPQGAVDLSLEMSLRGTPPAGTTDFWVAFSLRSEGKLHVPVHLVLRPLSAILNDVELPQEPGFQISDPIEKNATSVLQFELVELRSCGPARLGTVSAPSEESADGSLAEQDRPRDSAQHRVSSPNADALLRLFSRLPSDEERERLRATLCQRLQGPRGYGPVAYLILLVLFRMGFLSEGLNAAQSGLAADSLALFGIRRLLMLLLKWEWRSFSESLLDDVERFVCQLGDPFRTTERIAAIRTFRLSAPESAQR